MEGGRIEPFDNGGENVDEERLFDKRFGNILFFPMEQMGILRTNCIDCLDRTNVTQARISLEVLTDVLTKIKKSNGGNR